MQRREATADAAFATVLREAVETVEQAGYPFLVLGGLASSLVGRPRWTHDIDFLVRPDDARGVLEALRAAGYSTEETDPVWIYKAFKDDVMVDIISRERTARRLSPRGDPRETDSRPARRRARPES